MQKLLKKFFVPVLVISLVLGMTAFAEKGTRSGENPGVPEQPGVESGEKPEVPENPGTGSNEDPEVPGTGGITADSVMIGGKTYPVSVGKVESAAFNAVSTAQKIKDLLGSKIAATDQVELLNIIDATLPEGVTIPAGGIRLKFNVPGVKAGDVIKILHQKHDGTWEVLDTTTGNGTVSAVFTELSPVAFVKVKSQTPNDKGGTPVNPNKSPKTGR